MWVMRKGIIIILIIAVICIFLCVGKLKKSKQTAENEVEELAGKIILYFKNTETGELDKEYRNVSMKKIKENMSQTIIEEVLKGPNAETYCTTIPENTRLLSISSDGNEVKIDLSKEFIENQNGSAKDSLLAIYSIVNSLTEITEIEQVKFYIEGKEEESYKGYFTLNKPFVRSIWMKNVAAHSVRQKAKLYIIN